MNRIALAVGVFFLANASAFAQLTAPPAITPPAAEAPAAPTPAAPAQAAPTTPPAATPAPATQQAGLPAGCVAVRVSVPNVSAAKPDVPLTFRGEGSGVAALQACNPPGKTGVVGVNPSPTAGARIILRTSGGSGTVGLPSVYVAGDVHNLTCSVEAGALVPRLYKLDWRDGLPARLELADQTALLGDMVRHVAACRAAATPDILAQLK